jgi:hypothetical protein
MLLAQLVSVGVPQVMPVTTAGGLLHTAGSSSNSSSSKGDKGISHNTHFSV